MGKKGIATAFRLLVSENSFSAMHLGVHPEAQDQTG